MDAGDDAIVAGLHGAGAKANGSRCRRPTLLVHRDDDRAVIYRTTAEAMLDGLTGPEYLANETPGWEGVLKHGVYHTAKNLGVDESVMWGDFFLFEALTKALGERRRQPAAGC
jgi:hypothetical protein